MNLGPPLMLAALAVVLVPIALVVLTAVTFIALYGSVALVTAAVSRVRAAAPRRKH